MNYCNLDTEVDFCDMKSPQNRMMLATWVGFIILQFWCIIKLQFYPFVIPETRNKNIYFKTSNQNNKNVRFKPLKHLRLNVIFNHFYWIIFWCILVNEICVQRSIKLSFVLISTMQNNWYFSAELVKNH